MDEKLAAFVWSRNVSLGRDISSLQVKQNVIMLHWVLTTYSEKYLFNIHFAGMLFHFSLSVPGQMLGI